MKKIVKTRLFEDQEKPEMSKEMIEALKIEDCDIVYAKDGTAIDVKKLKHEMESAKVAIITQSPLFAPYVHEFVPIYTWLVPTMGTDGIRLFVNPYFAFKLTWEQKIFVIIHEIMHCVLLHMKRGKGYDPKLFNIAGDYEINAILIDTIDDFNEDFINKLQGLYEKKYLNINVEAIYKDLLENPPKNQGGGPGEGNDGSEKGEAGGKDVKVAGGGNPAGSDPTNAGTIISENQGEKIAEESGYEKDEIGKTTNAEGKWDQNSKKLLKEAEKQKAGSGKGTSLINILGSMHRGVVDWKTVFSRYVATALAIDKEQRLGNKKHLGGEFFRYGEKDKYDAIEKIIVCVDASGSTQSMLEDFINEVNGIIFSKKVKEIIVMFFTDGVHEESVQYLRSKNSMFVPKNVPGGGGTDFQKPLDWIKDKIKNRVSLCVFITDGEAPMPVKPPYANKFIWLVCNNFSFQEPFGKAIKIKI